MQCGGRSYVARRFHSGETEAPLLLAASSPPATIDPALYLPPALRSGACPPGRCVGGALDAALDLALCPRQIPRPVMHEICPMPTTHFCLRS